MNVFLEIGLKSVGLMAVFVVVAWFARKGSSSLRHRIWALSFVGLALLPLFTLRLPEIRVERPGKSIAYKSAPLSKALVTPVAQAMSSGAPAPLTISQTPSSSSTFPWEILGLVWLALLARLGRQIMGAAKLSWGGVDLAVDPADGVPPHTRVLRTASVSVPVTFGFVRPTILLPLESVDWDPARLRAVLLHEGAHIRRGDWGWIVFAQWVSVLYWPNPLVYYALVRMRAESELAADESVIRSGVNAITYAQTLVEIAASIRGEKFGSVLPFVEMGSLKARISAILSNTEIRRPLGRTAAILLLAACFLVVAPYAAIRVVAGPDTVRDGIIDQGDGNVAEIVAITSMEGGRAVSWDMHGARLRRPFPISTETLQMLGPSGEIPAGSVVRYLILRVNDSQAAWPTVYSAGDQPLNSASYGGSAFPGALFQDALGGSYRVLKLVAKKQDGEAGFRMKVPAGDWKLFAYKNFRQGEVREELNPEAAIRIAPQMPRYGRGTEATFLLPKETEGGEVCARILPNGMAGNYFQGYSGSASATSDIAPNSVTRVELLIRKLREVAVGGIPLFPDDKATYVLRHFLPSGLIQGEGMSADLGNGFSLRVSGVADKDGRIWSPHGIVVPDPARHHFVDAKDLSRPEKNITRLLIEESNNSRENAQTLFDTEGWPIFTSISTSVDDRRTVREFYAYLDGQTSSDVVIPIPSEKGRKVLTLDRGSSVGGKWEFNDAKEQQGLKVSYSLPSGFEVEGHDVSVLPLDAQGKEVRMPDGSLSYGSGSGWVNFQLPKNLADRVARVRIVSRPYDWVRFADVSLVPKAME